MCRAACQVEAVREGERMNASILPNVSYGYRGQIVVGRLVVRPRAHVSASAASLESAAVTEPTKAETYIGEKFTKHKPAQSDTWVDADIDSTAITIQKLDHTAVRASDVPKSIRFYTKVLGFKEVARPNFPFEGGWLTAGNVMLHIIQEDPSVDFNEIYLQVEDLAKAEETLSQFGIEYHKFVVPGTNAAQIFLYDPDYNGIELGANYGDIQELINKN